MHTDIASYTFDELTEGMETSMLKLLTAEHIAHFAETTDDHHPLHTSKEFAISQGYKDVIAHGLLVASFSSAIIGMRLPGVNAVIVSQSFKYRDAVYPGDTLLIKGKISKKEPRFSRIEVKIRMENNATKKRVASGVYVVKVLDPQQ